MSKGPAPEIPGFYFDPEKNRYFRIPPFPLSSGVSYTPKKRKRRPSFPKVTKHDKPNSAKNRRSIARLLTQRSLGLSLNEKFQFIAEKLGSKTFPESRRITVPLVSYNIVDLVPNTDHTGLWCTTADTYNCESIGFIPEQSRCTRFVALSKSTCLTPFRIAENGFAICSDIEKSSVHLLKEKWELESVRRLKNATPFACAGAKDSGGDVKLSYSDGPKAILVQSIVDHFTNNLDSRRLPSGGRGSSVVRLHKDIMVQCFGWRSGLHFNGLRGGDIIGLDPRQRRSYACQMKLGRKINVTQIVSLKDDRSLIAAYRNPQSNPLIHLWDTRSPSKPVLEYSSDCNVDGMRDEAPKYRLRINVDLKEQVLCCALPDLKVRLWDVKTGEEFFKYPVEDESSKVTVAAYSSQWDRGIRLGAKETNHNEHGLFMGTLGQGLYWKGD